MDTDKAQGPGLSMLSVWVRQAYPRPTTPEQLRTHALGILTQGQDCVLVTWNDMDAVSGSGKMIWVLLVFWSQQEKGQSNDIV